MLPENIQFAYYIMEETKHNIFTKTFRKRAHLKGVAKYSHIYRKIITIAKLAQIQSTNIGLCSMDHILTENIQFAWSETLYYGGERRYWKLRAEYMQKFGSARFVGACNRPINQTNKISNACKPQQIWGGWGIYIGL